MKTEENIPSKVWRSPKLIKLDISKTKSGTPKNVETGQGHSPAIS